MLQGHPIAATLPGDLGLGERFWYWRGSSGKTYIHSIYTRESCPPVAGAVYVLVDLQGGARRALAVGRVPQYLEGALDIKMLSPEASYAAEVHIHLLARNEESAKAVFDDLSSALRHEESRTADFEGFQETPVQFGLIAA